MSVNNLAIKVSGASVRFNIASEKIDNLKEYFVKLVKRQLLFEEFFALKNLSLDIKKGESWGIIGSNGSGKSTLLKLICGILSPYEGSVKTYGSIAPLIELGAGFDKDLTAKENVYLNGALLGHNKKFMDSQYNNILEFAELHRFMDMPVKNYSSGMRARLGFAIATMVQPQILIVDEVLSVGDRSFQKKCGRRMQEMLSGETTLLYVSHSHASVRSLCSNALWIDKGVEMMQGEVNEVCDAYEDFLIEKRILIAAGRKKEYDYLIVGGGLSGAVFAHKAAAVGKKCLVLEKRSHTGGNLYCEDIEGIDVHMYGPHIFHTSNKVVWDYVNKFTQFNNFISSPLVDYKGELYNLPFNMNTFAKLWGTLSPEDAIRKITEQGGKIVSETASEDVGENESEVNYGEMVEAESAANLEEKAINTVGLEIYEKFIKGCAEKQWGKACSELPPTIINRIKPRFVYDNNYNYKSRWQGIPEGSYNKIINRMLKNAEVKTDTDYFSDREGFDALAEKVVYTGAIDEYFDYCYGKLEYRGLKFENEVLECENYQGVAIVNYPDVSVPYTRIVEHKHFASENQSKTVITKEYPQECEDGAYPFYPVRDEKNMELYEKYSSLAEKEINTIFLGRLTKFENSSMAKTVEDAINVAEKEVGVKTKKRKNDNLSIMSDE